MDKNKIEKHLVAAEVEKMRKAIDDFRATLMPKAENLTPEERQQYGSIHEKNKLFVEKILSYATSHPNLKSPHVDYSEMNKDWADRTHLEELARALKSLLEIVDDTRILHDYDLYQNALVDYRYTKYMKEVEQTPEYDTKYQDLRQVVPGGRPSKRSASTDEVKT